MQTISLVNSVYTWYMAVHPQMSQDISGLDILVHTQTYHPSLWIRLEESCSSLLSLLHACSVHLNHSLLPCFSHCLLETQVRWCNKVLKSVTDFRLSQFMQQHTSNTWIFFLKTIWFQIKLVRNYTFSRNSFGEMKKSGKIPNFLSQISQISIAFSQIMQSCFFSLGGRFCITFYASEHYF